MGDIVGNVMLFIFIATGICIFAVVIINHILLVKLKTKYPEIAFKEIPFIDEPRRDPEKFFYFLRKKSKKILKEDVGLWRLRQSMIFFFIGSLLLPIVLIIAGFCFMVISKG